MKDLSHVVCGLGQCSACLREDCGPYDFLVGCAQTAPFPMGETPGPYIMEGADDPNAPVCELINNDPTTGVTGLKFDNLVLGDGECQRFAFRLDIGCLVDGMHVGEGCIEVSTKAGNQDVENPDNPPGYAEVTGPVCIEHHVQPE